MAQLSEDPAIRGAQRVAAIILIAVVMALIVAGAAHLIVSWF